MLWGSFCLLQSPLIYPQNSHLGECLSMGFPVLAYSKVKDCSPRARGSSLQKLLVTSSNCWGKQHLWSCLASAQPCFPNSSFRHHNMLSLLGIIELGWVHTRDKSLIAGGLLEQAKHSVLLPTHTWEPPLSTTINYPNYCQTTAYRQLSLLCLHVKVLTLSSTRNLHHKHFPSCHQGRLLSWGHWPSKKRQQPN